MTTRKHKLSMRSASTTGVETTSIRHHFEQEEGGEHVRKLYILHEVIPSSLENGNDSEPKWQ